MVDSKANGCTIQWEIENISHCWWFPMGGTINSSNFIADAVEGTEWKLRLCPSGCTDESYISLYLQRAEDCSGPDVLEVSFQMALLGNDGSNLKEDTSSKTTFTKGKISGFSRFEEREKIFATEREVFLPDDTLTVQCTIWNTEEKPVDAKFLYCRTVLKANRKWFVWRINEFGSLNSRVSQKFKDKSIDLDLILSVDSVRKLDIEMVSFDNALSYISCDVSIFTSEGEKTHLGLNEYFSNNLKEGILSPALFFPKTLMENKSRYFPNGVLSLEFSFSTVEYVFSITTSAKLLSEPHIEKIESKNIAALNQDLKNVYKDGTFSDTELRTSTHIFPAHKVILSARSPVFKSMLSYDMKEKNRGHIDITDFEDDTIRRTLLYMYTDSLEDLQFESAFELYKIADKYQILSLKSRCSAFLKEHLCPTNACEVLTLADLYSDDDLKSSVQDYILEQGKQFFCSQKWKDFMKTHAHLAADVMYKKISKE